MDDPYAWLERQPELRIARDPRRCPPRRAAPSPPRRRDDPPHQVRRLPHSHHRGRPRGLLQPAQRSLPAAAPPRDRSRVREEVRPAAGRGPRLLRARCSPGRARPCARSCSRTSASTSRSPCSRPAFRAADGPAGLPQHRAPHGRGIRRRRAGRSRPSSRRAAPPPTGTATSGARASSSTAATACSSTRSTPTTAPAPRRGTTRRAAASRSRSASNAFLGGAPCESLPAVQDAWLRLARAPHRAGVDGVDIRISAHGSHTDEPFDYGFNAEVLTAAACSALRAPRRQRAVTSPASARVRGDRYTQFLRRARVALRAAGPPAPRPPPHRGVPPDPVHGQLMGFPANLEFQWRDLARVRASSTGATLRTAWYERLGPPIDDLARAAPRAVRRRDRSPRHAATTCRSS